jgi:hypothetical protein
MGKGKLKENLVLTMNRRENVVTGMWAVTV